MNSGSVEVFRINPSERVVEIDNPLTGSKGYKRERYGVFGGPLPGSPKWHSTEGPTYPDLESAKNADEKIPPEVNFKLLPAPAK